MAYTEHYNLYVTESDDDPTFQNWREKLAGCNLDEDNEDASNMEIIDELLYDVNNGLNNKANQSTSINSTLLANNWNGSSAPYTQNISISGLTIQQNGIISVSASATNTQRDAARKAMLSVIGQQSGSITIAADGDIPEVDIPVCIIMLG